MILILWSRRWPMWRLRPRCWLHINVSSIVLLLFYIRRSSSSSVVVVVVADVEKQAAILAR